MEQKKINNKKRFYVVLIFILIIAISLFYFQNYSQKNTTLTQLSPQGDRQMMGYLIKTHQGKLIVIDGGTIDDKDQLIDQINQNGGKVDAWFLTHAHDDHVGAFTQIVNNTDILINKIYVSTNELSWYKQYEPQRADFTEYFLETLESEKIKDKVVQPNINDIFKIDNVQAEILGIKNPEITENPGNEQSMVIKFTTNNKSLLILGDTGEKSSEKLLKTQKEKLKSDILQIAHHGQQGATKELYKQVNPKICLWPTPEWLWNNDIGQGENTGPYKTFETREWIKEMNVKENYIAKDGNITINLF